MKRREILDRRRIDTVRGFACVLLVLFHSVAGAVAVLHQEDDSLKWLMQSLSAVRMPLFSMLSGLVYALRPVERGGAGRFIANKARRLLVPYFLVMILLLSLEAVAGHSKIYVISDIPYYFAFPWEHLWFLPSIFIVFFIFAIIDSLSFMRPREVSAIGLLFAMLGFLYAPQDIALFSINGAFFVFPFFACGVFLRRHEDEVNGRYWLIVTGLLIVTPVLFGLYAGLFGQQAGIAGRYTLQALAIGLSACTLIVLIFPPIHLMAAVGRRSFTIYLFHTVFASVANRLVQEFYSLIALSLVLGIVGPVIIDGLIKNRFTMLKPLIGEKLRLREAV